MKLSGSASGTEPGTKWTSAILILAVAISVFFYRSFMPGQTLFSNDGPLGRISATYHHLPESFAGVWNDLNFVGYREQGALTSISYGLRLVLGNLLFSKFYAPLGLLIAGLGAWFFFRESGLAGPACVLGALAAALNTDFFSTACWGIAAVPITVGMTFFAMAALLKTSGWRGWIRIVLGGLAVGMGVADGADVGAIFSLFVAAFVVYEALTTGGTMAARIGQASVRLLLVMVFAAFLAAQPIFALVDTQIKGVAGMEQTVQTREQHWDWATQWSLPKREALSLIVPALFGYRVDSPGGTTYWGNVGRDNAWDRYLANGLQGRPPAGYKRFTGSGIYSGVSVIALAAWAVMQSFLRENSVFNIAGRRRIRFWIGVLAVSLLLGFGRYAPFYRIIYGLPFFSTIRNPIKFIELLNFAFVILFAYGSDGLWRRYLSPAGAEQTLNTLVSKYDRYWLRGSLVLLVISLAGWAIYAGHRQNLEEYLIGVQFSENLARSISLFSVGQVKWYVIFLTLTVALMALILRRGFAGKNALRGAALLGLLVFSDYFNANKPWISYWDYQDKYAGNPVIDFLKENPGEHRVTLVPFRPASGADTFSMVYRIEWLQHQFPLMNIQTLDLVQMPRMPEDLKAFMDATKFDSTYATFPKLVRRYELTNTRYLLCAVEFLEMLNAQFPDLARHMKVITRFNMVLKNNSSGMPVYQRYRTQVSPDGESALVEFSSALPRAKLYSNWQCLTNDQAALAEIGDSGFDASQKVIVSENIPAQPSIASTNSDASTVSFVSYEPKKVVLKADATAPSVLLLNDRFDPSWRVSVDGRASTILHCNYVMRGVYLEPGNHRVEFRFQPPVGALYVSLAGMGVGAVLLGLLLFPNSPAQDHAVQPAPQPEPTPSPAEAATQTMSKKARRRAKKAAG